MPADKGTSSQRILMALDASARGSSGLESAVDLAARLEAELLGLFVEDLNLLRSAALPFVRQFSFLTGGEEAFDAPSVERELRARSSLVKKTLALAARSRRVKWAFRTVRGAVEREVRAAAGDADLLFVTGPSGPLARHLDLAACVSAAAGKIRKPLGFVTQSSECDRSVLLVYDGSDESGRAAALALRLAEGAELEVAVASPEHGREQLTERAGDILAASGAEGRWPIVVAARSRDLIRLAEKLKPGVVVISTTHELLHDCDLHELSAIFGATVLLVP